MPTAPDDGPAPGPSPQAVARARATILEHCPAAASPAVFQALAEAFAALAGPDAEPTAAGRPSGSDGSASGPPTDPTSVADALAGPAWSTRELCDDAVARAHADGWPPPLWIDRTLPTPTLEELGPLILGAWRGAPGPASLHPATRAALAGPGLAFVRLRRGGVSLAAGWGEAESQLAALFQAVADARGRCQTTPQPDPELIEVCLADERWPLTRQADRLRAELDELCEPGVELLELGFRGQRLRLAPCDVVATAPSHDAILVKAAEHFGVPIGPLLAEVEVARWATRQVAIECEPASGAAPRATPLYRGRPLVGIAEITRDYVARLAELLGSYLTHALLPDGRMTYLYDPLAQRESPEPPNLIRLWMASIALGRYAAHTGDRALYERSAANIAYNLEHYYREERRLGLIDERGAVKLGAVALAALAIVEHPARGRFKRQEERLLATTVELWRRDGSFRTFLKPAERNDNQNFYPGEALLLWASVVERGGDPSLARKIAQSFKYYRAWHRAQPNPAFVPWHTQAYFKHFAHSGDRAVAEFVFEINDWLLGVQQWTLSFAPDTLGRFYDPLRPKFGRPHSSSTGVYLEGLIHAFALADQLGEQARRERYRLGILRAIRSIAQLTFKDLRDMPAQGDRERLRGGVRTNVTDPLVRIDNVQHSLMGLLEVLARFSPDDYHHPPERTERLGPTIWPVPRGIELPPPPTAEQLGLPAPTPARLGQARSGRHLTLLAAGIDVAPMLGELAAQPELWELNDKRQRRVPAQRATQSIVLRSGVPPKAGKYEDGHGISLARAAAALPTVHGWVLDVAERLGGELGRCSVVRLRAGAAVLPHIDVGDYYVYRHRYHLVLDSDDGSLLGSGDQQVRMAPGELWMLDNKAIHWALNDSSRWRIHLIFDIKPASLELPADADRSLPERVSGR